jgi:transcriptional regulatory protein LevR/transcriptional regulator with AAA-type ATPase domain
MRSITIYEALKKICLKQYDEKSTVYGATTSELAQLLNMQRTNVSRELGKLYTSGEIKKKNNKPVLYYIDMNSNNIDTFINHSKHSVFDAVIGNYGSLKNQISLAKAAVVYPPKGLHTLIIGETGVGKSYFAKCMYKYAVEINRINEGNFVVFNCADYANNPQLLISHLFGVKKGTYTGAVEDKKGVIEKGRKGIVFLDEIHRLPPEGQEMLFTLIDEGKYTPLGSTEDIPIEVMIICATTENINSTLLRTFSRRIPVTISLPPLRERGTDERLNIIKIFIEEEAKRIGRNINIDEEALNALMSYNCTNNIGQLKSDIQIACAKAFLRCLSAREGIKLILKDFSEEVRSGVLKSKKVVPVEWNNKNIDIFNNDDNEEIVDKYNVSQNIYEFIERRNNQLKEKGFSEDEIRSKLTGELEEFINGFLNNIKPENDDDKIKYVVNEDLYYLLENFILLAEYRLKRKVSRNTFIGLLIHLNIFLNRIQQNKEIINPKIDEIRKKFSLEFRLAMQLTEKLEEKFDINVPIGEIGFIAMFFARDNVKKKKRVSMILAMHGNNTASSMADVANQLLNTSIVKAYDMPLIVKPETALNDLIEMVKENDEGMGTLLIVDMGSLKYFNEIIEQRTGNIVKCIDMATTLTVIEAARKAMLYTSLDEIVDSMTIEKSYLSESFNKSVDNKKEIVVTTCLTGEGTALKLKEIINKKFSHDNFEIINLSMQDTENFKNVIYNLRKKYKIKYIIGAFNPEIEDIPYISLNQLFNNYFDTNLNGDLNNDNIIDKIKKVYKEYMNLDNNNYIVDSFMEILIYMKDNFDIQMDSDKFNGLMMHYGSLIEKIINKEDTPKCMKLEYIKTRHNKIFQQLKNQIVPIEKELNLEFSDDDLGNIIEIMLEI